MILHITFNLTMWPCNHGISGHKTRWIKLNSKYFDFFVTTMPFASLISMFFSQKKAHTNCLLQSLADSCFPISQSPSANRLHGILYVSKRNGMLFLLLVTYSEILMILLVELFLRQFYDAHICSGGSKTFSRGGRVRLHTLLVWMFLV